MTETTGNNKYNYVLHGDLNGGLTSETKQHERYSRPADS